MTQKLPKTERSIRKTKGPPPVVFILIGLVLTGGVYQWGRNPVSSLVESHSLLLRSPQTRMSLGTKMLIAATATPEKQAGVAALAANDTASARAYFERSLQKHRNDPETLIYLNNATVGPDAFKIAVSVPISSNLDVALEILRGVGQAQDEANQNNLIGGSGLRVQIVDDENNAKIAQQVAAEFVKDPQVLAVVGHNASNASLAAVPVYQQGGLVMLSPTSFANQLSGAGSYIFRAVPSIRFMAEPLAQYIVKVAQKPNIAVCYDQQAPDNLSFRDELIASLKSHGGKLVSIDCNFSAPTFNPVNAVAQAISGGAQGLLITPHVDRLGKAIALAQANQGRLALFGSPTLYTIKTLEMGQSDFNGLVLPALWHAKAYPDNPFAESARQRWGGNVNWRTATAYDATRAIIAALKPGITRSNLQRTLRSAEFSATGAGEAVQFLPSGDRLGNSLLLQVQPTTAGYDFAPIRPLLDP
jgi:branched-chain amino acid transport system substrate-binding protein